MHADPDAFAAEVAALCGPAEADALRRYLADLAELYRLQLGTFIDRNLDSPLDLLGPELVTLARRGGFGRLSRHVERYFADDRLRRLFSFQALYAGRLAVPGDRRLRRHRPARHRRRRLAPGRAASPPSRARWPPPRPTPGSPSATARPSTELETSGRRVTAVRLADGERLPADAVVVTTDQPWHAGARACARPAPPGVLAVLRGAAPRRARRAARPGAPHDQLRRSRGSGVFDELTRDGRPMSDPSLLVSMPSLTDRSLAPEGGQVLSVVAPTPNLDRRSGGNPDLDWATLGPRYRDEVLATLEARGWTGLTGAIEVEEMATPLDWAAQGMAAGTPFALAHTFGQTGPFRPSTLPRRGPENVVLAGSSVQPGVGVPMVLISGRLAAERITGPVAR